MTRKNILYIHPYCNKESSDFVFLPGGLIGVINNLRKNKFRVIGINFPLEIKLNPNINIKKTIEKIDFQIVVIDCHWYYFLHGAQEIAKICKEINSECFVIVGGFSANFFRKKILKSTNNIDMIIRGDAETLLPKICKKVLSDRKKEYKKFPNITYKNFLGMIIDKEITSFDNNIDKYDYVDLTFMRHWEDYLVFNPGKEAPGISQSVKNEKFFYLPTQKGCINSCPACGGSKFTYKMLSNKKGVFVRSPQNIINDIIRLRDLGIKNIMISCESKLNKWVNIFKELNKKKIFVNILFEDWQLPNKELVEQMCFYGGKTDSGFLISSLSGNENIRIKNGKHYNNKELLEFVTLISKNEHSYASLWFSPNIVGSNQEYFQETISFAKNLIKLNAKSTKQNIIILVSPMEVDLTSQIYSNPSKFNCLDILWDYDYFINMLRNRPQGEIRGNMSYCSNKINIEEGNKMCEEMKEEINLLKENINDFRKTGTFSIDKELEIEDTEIKEDGIYIQVKNKSNKAIRMTEKGVKTIESENLIFQESDQELKPGYNKVFIPTKKKINHFVIRTENFTGIGLRV